MNIENKIFLKSSVDFKKLLKYGFKKKDDKYTYSTTILNNTFKVIVEIDFDQIVKGKIIELAFNEEYTNFRIENNVGEFSSKIRNEFEKILLNIKANCFNENNFISEQANRISNLIIKKYNDKPEFLWENDSNTGVFRNKINKKWYAIIMNVLKNKIDEGNEKVEIINVKINKDYIKDILLQKGFYKAYHMNKSNWVSIILDETVDDKKIMKYIIESYLLTNVSENKNKNNLKNINYDTQ